MCIDHYVNLLTERHVRCWSLCHEFDLLNIGEIGGLGLLGYRVVLRRILTYVAGVARGTGASEIAGGCNEEVSVSGGVDLEVIFEVHRSA